MAGDALFGRKDGPPGHPSAQYAGDATGDSAQDVSQPSRIPLMIDATIKCIVDMDKQVTCAQPLRMAVAAVEAAAGGGGGGGGGGRGGHGGAGRWWRRRRWQRWQLERRQRRALCGVCAQTSHRQRVAALRTAVCGLARLRPGVCGRPA
jgi:hypothetical protein